MSLDANTMVKAVKRAALEAVRSQKPMVFCLGEVASAEPLSIRVEQKMTLRKEQLLLTSTVRDFTVQMTVDHTTETEEAVGGIDEALLPHVHPYKGKKSFKVHLSLKKGEKVLLLRCDGGQKYIVLDRLEAQDE